MGQDVCPYRGLQVFNEEDVPFYFGRAGDIQRLVEKLKATRFLGVLGASGSGKSSLVRAGLIPALRAGELPGSQTWQVVPTFTPGSGPLEMLVLNFGKLKGADAATLLPLLRESERALHIAVRDFLETPAPKQAGTQRVLIIIDQLEEVFTLCDKETDRAQFLANLLYASSVPRGNCVVVVTLRADFYPKCAAYPEFSAALAAQQFLVSPMQYEGLVQAIQEPARSVQLTFEPGLVETIVDDVINQPGALPLLQHTLLELWKRRKGGQLTLAGYIDTGTVRGAIAKRAEAIYGSFSAAERTVMQRIMLRLTQPGEGTEDTRRRASLGELITSANEQAAVEQVIEALTSPENRLLTIAEDTGTPVIEVSHEALIRSWDRLRKWLDDNRDSLRLHRRLSEAAKEWQAQTNAGISDEGLLYRGLPLAQALEWQTRHEADLNDLERRFLHESEALKGRIEVEQRAHKQQELETAQRLAAAAQQRAELERKTRRKQLYFTIGLAVLFLGACGISIYAFNQYKDSRSRELASQATALLPVDPLSSVKLATEAAQVRGTSQAETALRASLLASYKLDKVLRGHVGPVNSVGVSPDGKWVATTSNDDTVRVWDAETGQTVQILNGHTNWVYSAAFSPDGRWLVTASGDKTALLWDVATGKLLRELDGHTEMVSSAAFSPDSKSVVTASWDKTARIWAVATGQSVRELKGHTNTVSSAVFSLDGKSLVTTSWDNTARIWDVASGQSVRELKGHTSWVSSAAFSPDGKWVLTAGADNMTRVWEAATGQSVRELIGHTSPVNSVVFSPDGKWVLTASNDKTARLWDMASGQTVQILSGHSDIVNSAVFSPDGRWVATASADKTARLWDVATGQTVRILNGHINLVDTVAFSPDDKKLVTASNDYNARVWDVMTGQTVQILNGHLNEVYSAAFSPDGKWVVTASTDRTARVWDVTNGQVLRELIGHTGSVNNAAFSPDGKKVVTTSADHAVHIYDCAEFGRLDSLLELARQRGYGPLTDQERKSYLDQ